VADQVETVRGLCAGEGGSAFRFAADEAGRRALWKARHDAYWASRQLAPGKEAFATDACVPISVLGTCIAEAQAAAGRSGLLCPIVGHVGDGNFHALVFYDPTRPDERARAQQLVDAIARSAIAHGGTCTGEHGIGMHKLPLLEEEHGAAVSVMQAIKTALDPVGIMNPGKTVPLASAPRGRAEPAA
jgi:D-lactate dehydrogenase (cytochrome)